MSRSKLFLLLTALGLLVIPMGCPSGGSGDDDDDGHSDDDDATGSDDDDTGSDDDDDATGPDDDDSASWPGPGPVDSMIGMVFISTDDGHGDDDDGHGDDDDGGHGDDDDGHGDDDDGGHGDDDDSAAGDDDDSALPDDNVLPVEGLEVTEAGTTNSAITDASGSYMIFPEDYNPAVIEITAEGDIKRVIVITRDAYMARRSFVETTVSDRDHEIDLYPELYGGPFDVTTGTVNIYFQAPEDAVLAGAAALIANSALGGRVFQGQDLTVPSNTLPPGQEQVVMFGQVAAGDQSLTVTAPSGFTCYAPATVPVEADAFTEVYIGCTNAP